MRLQNERFLINYNIKNLDLLINFKVKLYGYELQPGITNVKYEIMQQNVSIFIDIP